MTLVASLLFAATFAASIGVIMLTVRDALPRIVEVIEAEFAPTAQFERKIVFGAVKARGLVAAEIITFPARVLLEPHYRLAA